MTDNQYAPQPSHTVAHEPSNESAPPVPEGPAWYVDDNTPGNGIRPDWMPAQFKKASDLGKSYSELQKKLGAFTGAPDNYDLSGLELDEDQHLLKQLTMTAKEMNMSQEGLNKLLGTFAAAQETEANLHLDEQVKALGKDGERMLVEYKNWSNDYLKAEEREVVKEWVRTADDLKVFNRMMSHTHMSQVPTSQTMATANHFESVTELKGELTKNIDRFKVDNAYRKDWQLRMGRAVERNPNS